MSERPARVLCIGADSESAALRSHGFDTRGAVDSSHGVKAFLDGGADAVLLGASLAEPDAIATCRALKTLAAEAFLPIVFVTHDSDPETRVHLLDTGDDLCPSPCSGAELAARIRALLRIRDREHRIESDSRRLRTLALMDPLTELGNRRAFDQDLEREWSRAARSGHSLGLLMIDIDRFKAFNDRFGHQTGDIVLRGVAQAIEEAIRQSDRPFRWGGEEFAVLLPETNIEGCSFVAERVRLAVSRVGSGPLSVTVSVGVAVLADPAALTREDLIETADRALRRAKAEGRNRVVSIDEATSPVSHH